MKEIRNIIDVYNAMDWTGQRAALATVIKVEESAYRRVGARMLVKDTGTWIGGISGGCLEGDALQQAQKAIFRSQASVIVYDTMEDDAHQIGVGLGCNGRIEVLFTPLDPSDPENPVEQLKKVENTRNGDLLIQLIHHSDEQHPRRGKVYLEQDVDNLIQGLELNAEFFEDLNRAKEKHKSIIYRQGQIEILIEYIRPEWHIVLAGDNYDLHAFMNIAQSMGCEISVLGKAHKLDKSVYAKAKNVKDYSAVSEINIDHYSAVILMTHDYKKDYKLLQYFLENPVRYVGMLGPRKRMLKMQSEMGVDLEALDWLFAPVGLDVGAESPEEIALSIIAEIVSVFRGRTGTSLRLREGPIHERENVDAMH